MVGTADLGVQSSREKALDTEIWEWDQMVFIVLVDVGHGVASLLDVQGAREGHFSPRVSLASNAMLVIPHSTCSDGSMMAMTMISRRGIELQPQ